MDFEETMRQVQDTLTVMAGIQARQAAVAKEHSNWLEEQTRSIVRHNAWLEEHNRLMSEHDRHILEIDEKLNAMINIVDGMRPKPDTPPHEKDE